MKHTKKTAGEQSGPFSIRYPGGPERGPAIWCEGRGMGLRGAETNAEYIVVWLNREFEQLEGANRDVASDLLGALARAEQTLRNLARCGALSGDYVEIAENEAENLRMDIAKAKGEQ